MGSLLLKMLSSLGRRERRTNKSVPSFELSRPSLIQSLLSIQKSYGWLLPMGSLSATLAVVSHIAVNPSKTIKTASVRAIKMNRTYVVSSTAENALNLVIWPVQHLIIVLLTPEGRWEIKDFFSYVIDLQDRRSRILMTHSMHRRKTTLWMSYTYRLKNTIQHATARMKMARSEYVLALGAGVLIVSKYLSVHVG